MINEIDTRQNSTWTVLMLVSFLKFHLLCSPSCAKLYLFMTHVVFITFMAFLASSLALLLQLPLSLPA